MLSYFKWMRLQNFFFFWWAVFQFFADNLKKTGIEPVQKSHWDSGKNTADSFQWKINFFFKKNEINVRVHWHLKWMKGCCYKLYCSQLFAIATGLWKPAKWQMLLIYIGFVCRLAFLSTNKKSLFQKGYMNKKKLTEKIQN